MKKIIIFSLFFYSLMSHALDLTPPACKNVSVSGEKIILSAKTPSLFLLHNISSFDLWLIHPADWSSQLQPDQWSALLLDKESYELNCVESRPGHEQQIHCAGASAVCVWEGVKFPNQMKGTLRSGENMSLPVLMAHLRERGFYLP